jgi:hypothetical protein
MNATTGADGTLQALRGDVIAIVLGAVFLTIGAIACGIAAIRWRRAVPILVWWGISSGLYGLQEMGQRATILTVLPHSLKSVAPYVNTAVMYLLLISALLAWRELALGKLRLLIQLEIGVGLAIALLGIGTFVLGGAANKWTFYNNLLAVIAMIVLLAVVLVPRFSRLLVIPHHRVLAAGTLFFAVEVLYTNLGTVLGYQPLPLVDALGFAILLFSLDTWRSKYCLPTSAVCFPSKRNWRRPGRYNPQFSRRKFLSLRTCVSRVRTVGAAYFGLHLPYERQLASWLRIAETPSR